MIRSRGWRVHEKYPCPLEHSEKAPFMTQKVDHPSPDLDLGFPIPENCEQCNSVVLKPQFVVFYRAAWMTKTVWESTLDLVPLLPTAVSYSFLSLAWVLPPLSHKRVQLFFHSIGQWFSSLPAHYTLLGSFWRKWEGSHHSEKVWC